MCCVIRMRGIRAIISLNYYHVQINLSLIRWSRSHLDVGWLPRWSDHSQVWTAPVQVWRIIQHHSSSPGCHACWKIVCGHLINFTSLGIRFTEVRRHFNDMRVEAAAGEGQLQFFPWPPGGVIRPLCMRRGPVLRVYWVYCSLHGSLGQDQLWSSWAVMLALASQLVY